MVGEEEGQPEEQGVVGELEEAECDGVRCHGGDSESLGGTNGGEIQKRDGESKIVLFRLKEDIQSVFVYDRRVQVLDMIDAQKPRIGYNIKNEDIANF